MFKEALLSQLLPFYFDLRQSTQWKTKGDLRKYAKFQMVMGYWALKEKDFYYQERVLMLYVSLLIIYILMFNSWS